MAIRGKKYNPYDDLVSFVTSNRIDTKEENRLRGVINRILEFKLPEHKCGVCGALLREQKKP